MIASELNNIQQLRANEPLLLEDMLLHLMTYQADLREGANGKHILRFQHYTRLLAEELRHNRLYPEFFENEKIIEHLMKVAPLHDIGAVGIPDRILLKPGRLTQDEFEIIKTHTQLGRDLVLQVEEDFTSGLPLFALLKEITYHHHERWNGSGYPQGLWGDDIPVSARIIMVADVYDTLVSRRVYKAPVTHLQAVEIITHEAENLFDPNVVAAFNRVQDKFYTISKSYAESEKDFARRLEFLSLALGVDP